MKNKKIKLFALSAVLLLAGGAYVANHNNLQDETRVVDAAESVTISTVEEFISCFDGSAKYYNRDIVLTADLDLEGHEFTGNVNMAGEFQGTFDGGGHTVKNFSANCLFNIIGTNGIVKDLNLIGTKYGNVSGFGFLCYQNNGIIDNCFVSVTVNTACNTYGAFALMNKGTISNSASYMTINDGNTFYSFARDAGTIENCSYNANNTGLVAQTGTAKLDENITATSRGNEGVVHVKLEAPSNATIVDNVLSFDLVENATSYQIEYRDNEGNVKAKEKITSGQELSVILGNGSYNVFIKSIGNGVEYLDSSFVQVTGTYEVTDVVSNPIAINEESTKISGAGVAIYFADKPEIALNDIDVELVSFYYPADPNATNSIASKVEYISGTGRFYFTLTAGYLASHKVECTFKVSYVYNGAYYEQEVSFASNELVTDTVKAAINWQYDNDDEPTAVRFIGTVENVKIENLERVDFVFALDGVERTVEVNTLYTSISGLDGFAEEENKYYAVYVLKGLDAKDDEGNYKYRGRSFSADIKVTLKDETVVTAKEAKSFTLKPAASAVNSIAIDGTKTKVEGAGVFVVLSDKPAVAMADIDVEILSYTSNDYPGVATSVMANAPAKVYYNPDGTLYFTIGAGVPNGCDAEMVVRISYTLDGAYYQQDITFVGNAYQG